MEEQRGQDRGSYIWVRSMHNICIEQLWVDWTSMVGSKWKSPFQDLEVTGGLNPDNTAHIWLLHHLFLPLINHKAIQWANAWNMHKMALPDGQWSHSPADLWWFSILQTSSRPNVDEIDEYGIDWEAYEDQHIQAHHTEGNQPDHLGHNPFVAHRPDHFNIVEVEEPNCPLSPQHLTILHQYIVNIPDSTMTERKILWMESMQVCAQFVS
ncbi:uncharacterized protein HD556DRAFT_1433174 [Suillus plorans]|uniref:Integrase core domain-containing protein n=1 Tax=Suillus plorans TaxID=116603 RepID=A0A9P7DEC5_9AGAM|nr:uncharacterized protein HD556DRAFT_1433174 [Suillus plorans]KAG1790754.1 hypothetical protein HD556DRAFT_1433174 [Suillus plorans]